MCLIDNFIGVQTEAERQKVEPASLTEAGNRLQADSGCLHFAGLPSTQTEDDPPHRRWRLVHWVRKGHIFSYLACPLLHLPPDVFLGVLPFSICSRCLCGLLFFLSEHCPSGRERHLGLSLKICVKRRENIWLLSGRTSDPFVLCMGFDPWLDWRRDDIYMTCHDNSMFVYIAKYHSKAS